MPPIKRPRPNNSAAALPVNPRARDLVAAAILAALGIVVYSNSFSAPFVFDGAVFIRNIFKPDAYWPWQLPFGANRPIGLLSFSLNYAADELNVWGYHAVNLAIHVLAGWVLFGIVRRTLAERSAAARYAGASYGLALATAAIWLAHPLQTESITYIYQRLEALMGLFYLLTLYCFIRALDSRRPAAWYAASIVACALGMGTKEVTITAPLLVLWYDRALVSASWRELFRARKVYYAALAGTWVLLAIFMIRGSGENEDAGLLFVKGLTPWNYLFSQPGVIVHYLRQCFWPVDLCLDYRWPVAERWGEIVPPMLVVLALLGATVWCMFRRPALGFLAGSFFLILAPTSSVAPIRDLSFEHRLYLPLAAGTLLVVLAAYEVWRRLAGEPENPGARLPRTALATSLVLLIVGVLSYLTVMRNRDYASPLSLWQDTVRKAPHNLRACKTLAEALCDNQQPQQAIEVLNQVLKRDPRDAEALNDRGIVEFSLGNIDQALADTSQAIELKPDYGSAYFNRAGLYLKMSRYEPAIADLTQTLKLDFEGLINPSPASRLLAAGSYRTRATASAAIARFAPAEADYTRVIELGQGGTADYLGRGRASEQLGKSANAIGDYNLVLQHDPNNQAALQARAWLLSTCPDPAFRNGQRALADASRLAKLTGLRNRECLETLAAASAESGDFASAVKWQTQAAGLKAGDAAFSRNANQRLEMYRAGKPYRSARAKPSPSAQQPE